MIAEANKRTEINRLLALSAVPGKFTESLIDLNFKASDSDDIKIDKSTYCTDSVGTVMMMDNNFRSDIIHTLEAFKQAPAVNLSSCASLSMKLSTIYGDVIFSKSTEMHADEYEPECIYTSTIYRISFQKEDDLLWGESSDIPF